MTRAAAAALALLLAACGPSPATPDGSVCPSGLPACSDPPPSYATAIRPLITGACLPCHAPGSRVSGVYIDTYDGARAHAGAMIGQLYTCQMPPREGAPLTPQERTTLLTWLQCGAPNN